MYFSSHSMFRGLIFLVLCFLQGLSHNLQYATFYPSWTSRAYIQITSIQLQILHEFFTQLCTCERLHLSLPWFQRVACRHTPAETLTCILRVLWALPRPSHLPSSLLLRACTPPTPTCSGPHCFSWRSWEVDDLKKRAVTRGGSSCQGHQPEGEALVTHRNLGNVVRKRCFKNGAKQASLRRLKEHQKDKMQASNCVSEQSFRRAAVTKTTQGPARVDFTTSGIR